MTEQKTDRVTITETSGEDSLLKFPTEFPIKVMGLTTPDFAEVIGSAVREIAPDFDPAGIKTEYSKTRKYTSLTVVVNAQSKDQLDTIYRMLTSHPMVQVVL